ncbi:hypothetical protein A2U01_0057525, partial [Trifolium medium]|nr:hypothetical protein [Trifolium medium]
YNDVAARMEEQLVLKNPNLKGKTRQEMRLKEYKELMSSYQRWKLQKIHICGLSKTSIRTFLPNQVGQSSEEILPTSCGGRKSFKAGC